MDPLKQSNNIGVQQIMHAINRIDLNTEDIDRGIEAIFLFDRLEKELEKSARLSENPHLEEIIKKSNKKAEYKRHPNGFYLANDALTIQYVESRAEGWNFFGLCFNQIEPKIRINGDRINPREIPKNLECSDILVISPHKEVRDHRIYRYTPDTKKEWFDKGTELLKEAAEKYHFRRHYDNYLLETRRVF